MLKNILKRSKKCPLCEAKRKTEWLYSDELFWIARCDVHVNQWMVVIREHKDSINEFEMRLIRNVLDHLLGEKTWSFRGSVGTIKNHWHDHIIEEN